MIEMGWWLIPLLLLAVVLGLLLAWRPLRGTWQEVQEERAREMFHLQREHLEAKFVQMAEGTGKPRGLRWKDCDWADEFQLVRDKATKQIHALVGVTIQFEAIPGSDMEDWPQVAQARVATGVYFFQRGHWLTQGRALFNMNPLEALERYKDQYEAVPT